jgi:putative heme-binding domain-containing protein
LRCLVAILAICGVFAQTPIEPAADTSLGQRLFESQCAVCHGQTGDGGRGPNLHRPKLNRAPDDAALRKAIADGIPPEMPGAWQLSPREVASVAAFVKTLGSVPSEPVPGDPGRGEQVYKAQGCANCHMIGGDGSGFGPELTAIGARRSPVHLRESIVTPEASVPDGFLLVELVTANGATARGIRMNEDTFSIQIKDSNNAFHSFRKADLKEVRKLRGKSPMPPYTTLAGDELTNLIAYLASLRGKS